MNILSKRHSMSMAVEKESMCLPKLILEDKIAGCRCMVAGKCAVHGYMAIPIVQCLEWQAPHLQIIWQVFGCLFVCLLIRKK